MDLLALSSNMVETLLQNDLIGLFASMH